MKYYMQLPYTINLLHRRSGYQEMTTTDSYEGQHNQL